MGLIKVTERFYYLPYSEETDRPSLYYFLGNNYSAVIDAGNSQYHVEYFYDLLRKENLPLPKYTILTHWHWDHTFGMCAVSGETIATKATNDKLREVQNWKWDIKSMEERLEKKQDIPFCHEHILKEFEDLNKIEVKIADIEIEKEMVLDLGGITLQITPQISTHCIDSLFVYCPEIKSLFVGDGSSFDYYHGEVFFKDRLEVMEKFIVATDFDTFYHSHIPTLSRQEILEALHQHHSEAI